MDSGNRRMPFIFLPPFLGGIRGGGMCYILIDAFKNTSF
jgi:hypothetical protein